MEKWLEKNFISYIREIKINVTKYVDLDHWKCLDSKNKNPKILVGMWKEIQKNNSGNVKWPILYRTES